MKIAKFFAVIFAVIGVFLLVGSYGFLLTSRNDQIHVLEVSQGAVACSDAFAQALDSGDLTAAAQLMYGSPDLGVEGTPSDSETAQVWEAFLDQMHFAYTGKCYAVENGFAREASITVLDIVAVTQKLPELTQEMISQKITSAIKLEDIYDEEGHFHQELADRILRDALEQCLYREPQTIQLDVTVKLVNRDGAWWVVPDQALLQAITGLM